MKYNQSYRFPTYGALDPDSGSGTSGNVKECGRGLLSRHKPTAREGFELISKDNIYSKACYLL